MAPPASVMKRLIREVRSLESNPPDSVRVQVDDCDITDVRGWVQGARGTPFESGYFLITFSFPSDFPSVPPTCRMSTRIFHPNVSVSTGEICVSTLKKDWQPEFGIGHVLTVIKCLLISPNPDSALNAEAGRLLQEDYKEYAATARLWTSVHAAHCPSGLFVPTTTMISTTSSAPPLRRSHSGNASALLDSMAPDKETLDTNKATGPNSGSSAEDASHTVTTGPLSIKMTSAVKKNPVVKRGVKRL